MAEFQVEFVVPGRLGIGFAVDRIGEIAVFHQRGGQRIPQEDIIGCPSGHAEHDQMRRRRMIDEALVGKQHVFPAAKTLFGVFVKRAFDFSRVLGLTQVPRARCRVAVNIAHDKEAWIGLLDGGPILGHGLPVVAPHRLVIARFVHAVALPVGVRPGLVKCVVRKADVHLRYRSEQGLLVAFGEPFRIAVAVGVRPDKPGDIDRPGPRIGGKMVPVGIASPPVSLPVRSDLG